MTEPQLERWATRGASDAQSLVLRDHCWAIPTASSDLHSYSTVCIPFSIHAYPRWEYLPMSHILSSHGGLEGALTAKLLLENPFCRKAFLEPSQIALGTGLAFCPSWPWHIPAATGYRSSMIISKFTSHRALLSGNACFDKPVVCIQALQWALSSFSST